VRLTSTADESPTLASSSWSDCTTASVQVAPHSSGLSHACGRRRQQAAVVSMRWCFVCELSAGLGAETQDTSLTAVQAPPAAR
jgi:hypothetical protein